jgi:hypothetical protein
VVRHGKMGETFPASHAGNGRRDSKYGNILLKTSVSMFTRSSGLMSFFVMSLSPCGIRLCWCISDLHRNKIGNIFSMYNLYICSRNWLA